MEIEVENKGFLYWLSERLRYLIRWPVNLVLDLPVRILRLIRTAAMAGGGLLFLLPELADALRYQELGRWLAYKAERILLWLHRLFAQLFDLVGGPELGQFVLHFFASTTPLTPQEKETMMRVLGEDGLRYNEVRVAEGGIFNLIFRINGNLAFATWRTINLPNKGQHTRANLPIVAHELTHVYQYERIGSRYLGEAIYMLIKTKRDCYDYGGPAGLAYACLTGVRFADYNREQQAMIVQDYVALQSHLRAEADYEPFIAELRAGEL